MLIGVTGYLSALAGFLPGALLTLLSGDGRSVYGRIMSVFRGFAAGALISAVCFGMMPRVFQNGVLGGIIGLLAGVGLSGWADGYKDRLSAKAGGAAVSVMVFAGGVVLHGVPEGIALGTVLAGAPAAGLYIAAALSAHCLIESFVVSGFMRREGFSGAAILTTAVVLAIPVGAGAMLSAWLSSDNAVSLLCTALSSGIMLYLACGEVLPQQSRNASEPTSGGWTLVVAVAALLGFVAGVKIL